MTPARAARCESCGQRIGINSLVERIVLDGYVDTATICYRARSIAGITNKRVYNALTGLVRTGRLRRLGYGSYEIVQAGAR